MCYINSGKGSYAASDRRFDHTFPSLILNLMVNIRLKDVNTKGPRTVLMEDCP